MADDEIVATRVTREIELNAAHSALEWQNAMPISFSTDWQGQNVGPSRTTQIQALWSPQMLYLKFTCRYQELCLFSDADPNGRRDHLWDRDVAEVFLQPDPSRESYYKEFQVSPNGMWVDLDIFPGGRRDLESGMSCSAFLDEGTRCWMAELAIPMRSLAATFDSRTEWRVNFFRVEGSEEPRSYLAWQPTHSPQPNFHVPHAFGRMRFKR